MSDGAAPLSERYFFLAANQSRPIDVPVGDFWAQLMSGDHADPVVAEVSTADGWLVTSYEMAESMSSSEMHPDGDELHYLVSGALDLVLEHDDRDDEVVELRAGDGAMVAKGVWHRFVVREPALGVAMTFGRGTQHRSLES
jgi:mannose-6-phosphate isomerase-like protein (cupin superfamily)